MGVWIETYLRGMKKEVVKSHPSWVCGLKRAFNVVLLHRNMSHPSWVCGLKHILTFLFVMDTVVTPFVGVWIETDIYLLHHIGDLSHTLRGCVD